MIPTFPEFKNIELTDREEIEKITSQFLPYCDFEFVDLWTYNPEDTSSISILDNNFILKRQDIITREYFYSIIGNNNTKNAIEKILEKTAEQNTSSQLKQVPEATILSDPDITEYFNIQEDRDNFDYIYSVNELANLEGSKHGNRRNHISKFRRLYPEHIVQFLDLSQEKTKYEIKELFLFWEKQKEKDRNETIVEFMAIERIFDLINILPIYCIGIYDKGRLIGFTTFHITHHNYGDGTFIKGDITYRGIYEYLLHNVAKHLKKLGCEYFNFEQDLGIENLREAKNRYNPVFFLKKYTIEKKVHV